MNYTIYFSATATTAYCVNKISQGRGVKPDMEINLADDLNVVYLELTSEDVAIIASPVYGGRLPVVVADALSRLKGNGAKAIAAVVYGNRDFDDALIELTDLLHNNGFSVIGAGAFIARHSIFPKVATSRPDLSDDDELVRFGKECERALAAGINPAEVPYIKGNRPYKQIKDVVLAPIANESDCIKCGVCARKCPVGAISADTPWISDTTKCISCGRCITVCSQNARKHKGLKYAILEAIFKAAFSKRKKPQWKVAKSL